MENIEKTVGEMDKEEALNRIEREGTYEPVMTDERGAQYYIDPATGERVYLPEGEEPPLKNSEY